MARAKRGKRSRGTVDHLPSKRFRARYTGPDTIRHTAPWTFDTRMDAEAWLVDEWRKVSRGEWSPPRKLKDQPKEATFGEYAERWLAGRLVRGAALKPRTRAHYRSLLDQCILPTFSGVALKTITSESVRDWYAVALDNSKPTLRAHAYSLLRTILTTAVVDEKIAANPCRIDGAGQTKPVIHPVTATLGELEIIATTVPERYRLMVLFGSWCALRFGELIELRRKDIDMPRGVIHVHRAVVRCERQLTIGPPKSDAGIRDVAIPPHLMPMVKEHLGQSITGGKEGLLFPAAGDPMKHLANSTFYRVFHRARDAAGRPDLRVHDLRHTGATWAAQNGATVKELQDRLGHSTSEAAMRYQHTAEGRDMLLAEKMSAWAEHAASV
jgi:integrase